ncbi:MAG: hypothetical protein ACYDCO_23160 [Armatimonadota bacterium]
MREQSTDSPFRDVREGRPWQYQARLEEEPEYHDRSSLVTWLGLGMLAFASVLAPFTFRVLPMLSYLFLFGISSPVFQDVLLLSSALLLGALSPVMLSLAMGIGLFRLAPWSRRWSIITLPCILLLGGGVVGLYYWILASRHSGGQVAPTDPAILTPLGWYALAMVPLTIALLIGLTRRRVAEELEEMQNAK